MAYSVALSRPPSVWALWQPVSSTVIMFRVFVFAASSIGSLSYHRVNLVLPDSKFGSYLLIQFTFNIQGWFLGRLTGLIKDELHKATLVNKNSLQSYLLLLCHERAIILCVIFMRCPRLCSGVTTAWNAAQAQGTADKATGSELNGIKFKILCVSCLIVLSSFAGTSSKQKKHQHSKFLTP